MRNAAVLGLAAALTVVVAGVAGAARHAATQGPVLLAAEKVTICHYVGNGSWDEISPSVDAVVNGHDKHPNDIIPPFDYDDKGQTVSYPGKNWDATGQGIWDSGCVPPAPPACSSETSVTATDATGQGSIEQYHAPDHVYIRGENFPPNTALTFTVTHRQTSVVKATDTFDSGSGNFLKHVWDGANAVEGDEGYRVEVTYNGCAKGDNFQYDSSGPPPQPSLTVRKVVVGSATPPTNFSFIVNGDTIPFETDGQNTIQLPPGTYDVKEEAEVGFTTTLQGCAGIVLAVPQPTVPVCTITNTAIPLKLIVRKVVIGSSVPPTGFSFTVNGQTAPFEPDGENELTLPPGTYSVTEIPAPGFTTTLDGCSGIVLAVPQQTVPVCTVTNTAQGTPGLKLRVRKVVVGASTPPSDFRFTVNGQTTPFEPDGENVVTLPPGTYTVTEPRAPGFRTTRQGCTGIVLSAPQQTIPLCTITNTAVTPRIRVRKVVLGASTPPNEFSFTVNGVTTPFEADGENVVPLPPGTYDVTEEPVAGFSATLRGCSGIVLEVPQDRVPICTITNTAQQPRLIVRKVVVGSTTPASAFAFTINGVTTPFEADGENEVTLPAGTYDVTEAPAPGFTTTRVGCSDVVLSVPQQTPPVCTITNVAQGAPSARLRVRKVVVGADAPPSDFAFTVNGKTTQFEPDGENELTLPPGTYDVTEAPVSGFTTTTQGCTGIVLSVPQQTVPVCTITNTAKSHPDVYPIGVFVNCVGNNPDGSFSATFGYFSPNRVSVTIETGPLNRVTPPGPQGVDRGQPTVFESGSVPTAFQVSGPAGTSIVWSLTTPSPDTGGAPVVHTATATAEFSHRCTDPPPDPIALPIGVFVTCIDRSATTFSATFGYSNLNPASVSLPIGPQNNFAPPPENRGQPIAFVPGVVRKAFTVAGIANSTTLKWTLDTGNGPPSTATASSSFATLCSEPLPPNPEPGPEPSPGPGPGEQAIGPFVQCVTNHGSSYDAVFGYQNDNADAVTIPVGENNRFLPAPASRGQTTRFESGNVQDAFTVTDIPLSTAVAWAIRHADATRFATAAAAFPDKCAAVEPPAQPIGLFACIVNRGSHYDAVFGYENDNRADVTIPVGLANLMLPQPLDRGQPTVFSPGRHDNAFTVRGIANTVALSWGVSYQGRITSLVTASYPVKCGAPEIDRPIFVFPLCVRRTGTSYTAVFTTVNLNRRDVIVPIGARNRMSGVPIDRGQLTVFHPGAHWVAVAVRGQPASRDLTWTVASAGQVHRATASADSARACLTTPVEGTVNVELEKTVKPPIVAVGDTITYTIVVRNAGTTTAQRTVLVDRQLDRRVELLSATTSNGSCKPPERDLVAEHLTCVLDPIDPGESTTIVVKARARAPGVARDRVTGLTLPANVSSHNTDTASVKIRAQGGGGGAGASNTKPKPKPKPPFTG